MTKQEFKNYTINPSVMGTLPSDWDDKLDELIQEAIAEYEQKQWQSYPEQKPILKSRFQIQCQGSGVIKIDKWTGLRW